MLTKNQYIVEGEVTIQPGVMVASFCKWGPQYHVEFDIKVFKYPESSINILQMTIGERYGRLGDRIPMVELTRKSFPRIHVASSVNDNHNFFYELKGVLNTTYHFEICQVI